MKHHAFTWNRMFAFHPGEHGFIVGFAWGRVPFDPAAKWLYSFRGYLGFVRFEWNWTTGPKRKL